MKKYSNQIIIRVVLTIFVVSVTFSSCKKDFFDINSNPNFPLDVPVNYLLPSAEAAIAHAVGNDLEIYGGLWAQYWTQSPLSSQYKTFEQYSPSSTDFDHPWINLFADGLQDLQTISIKATAEGKTKYAACAKILQAYAFQVLTDNFGDIPFSEALKGANGVVSPHYDKQSDVYNGLINLLNQGIDLIEQPANANEIVPGNDDLLLQGDMALWEEFANTLKLKLYLRLSEIEPNRAQAGIQSLDSAGAIFLGAGQEVKMNYSSEGGKTNPLYSSIVQLTKVQNLVASSTCIDYLNNNNDPRVDAFYEPASNGSQTGIPQGAYGPLVGSIYSLPSAATGANGGDDASALAPVKLMTAYESLFLQAEAAARGWTSGSAQSLYEAGITESFTAYGLADTLATNYFSQDSIKYPVTGPFPDQLRHIITQKWIAMCGNQNDEAWIESRRTNYPNFFTVSLGSIIGGNLFPQRMFYPSNEVTTNGNFPGQKNIYDRVWWDVN